MTHSHISSSWRSLDLNPAIWLHNAHSSSQAVCIAQSCCHPHFRKELNVPLFVLSELLRKLRSFLVFMRRNGVRRPMDWGVHPGSAPSAIGSSGNHPVSLSLTFRVCKMGITLSPTSQVFCEVEARQGMLGARRQGSKH